MIEFGEYLPDLPPYKNPGTTEAKNCIPWGKGYKELGSLSAYSTNALDARAQGAFGAQDSDGNTTIFAGDASKIYKLTDTTWGDVSLAGGYNTAEDATWDFIQFGDTVIATNYADAMQKWTLGSSTAWANLGGSPPKARHLAVVRDFVVCGNLDESGTLTPNKIRWSAIDNAEDWSASPTTQSDSQVIAGNGGAVQGIVGGEYGVIFLERSIYRMTYVGSPLIFQFDEVEQTRGTAVPGSIAALGNLVFYLSDEGFYQFDGTQSIPIGANKVDKTFYTTRAFDQSYRSRVTSAIDPINHLVLWAFPGTGHTAGDPNFCMIYDWVNKKWSYAEFDCQMIFRSLSTGYTLDTLDTISTDLDSLAFSLDSRAWTGGSVLLAAFDTSNQLAYFSGTALAAVLDTTEFQPIPGRRSFINKVRPIVDGTGATTTVQMGTREDHQTANAFASAVSVNSTGDAPVRSDSRYHRIRCNISGGFDFAQGVDVTWRARGQR